MARVPPITGRADVPRLDGHVSVLELLVLLLLPEQPAIRPAATTSAAPATANRRGPIVPASLPMAHHSPCYALEHVSH